MTKTKLKPKTIKPTPAPTPDYSEYTQQERPQSQLKVLSDLAEEQRRIEKEIANTEEVLKKLNEALQAVSEVRLPEMMEDLNLKEFKTRSGLVVTLGENIFASISKDNAPLAFDWLDDNGFSKLIKRAFIVKFGKEEEKWANKFAADLRRRKKPVNVEEKKEVHHSTLKAFVKEELTNGRDVPTELFGVHRQMVTKVTVPL
jgi:hypothetical protein